MEAFLNNSRLPYHIILSGCGVRLFNEERNPFNSKTKKILYKTHNLPNANSLTEQNRLTKSPALNVSTEHWEITNLCLSLRHVRVKGHGKRDRLSYTTCNNVTRLKCKILGHSRRHKLALCTHSSTLHFLCTT